MSTTVTPPAATAEAPVFDAKAHIEARMNGKPAPQQQTPAATPNPGATPAPEPPRKADSSRSERRRLRAAEERTATTVLRVLKESGVIADKKIDEPAVAAPVEPKRADFPAGDEGTAAFLRAGQKFDREQEAKTSETNSAKLEEERARYSELDAKAAADIAEKFPDWDKLSKEWAANEDVTAIHFDDIPVIMGLLANSDIRASVSYFWMQNPEAFLELCEMPEQKQIAAFHRLEGKLEREYASVQKAAPAAEPEKGKEDRKHLAEEKPAKATPGEPAAGGQPAKPRPSSEIVARGGSPPPEAPEPGSAAWMALRNQKLYGK